MESTAVNGHELTERAEDLTGFAGGVRLPESGRLPRGKRGPYRARRRGSAGALAAGMQGRDHRRYYQEQWRSDFLMVFDAANRVMVCVVCGNSLASLKLSTVKRHIQQRHPHTLLWSSADKELLLSHWEATQRPHSITGTQEQVATGPQIRTTTRERRSRRRAGHRGPTPPDPLADTLERYANATLRAWLRQEFLMEYWAAEGRLLCMVCGKQLPSLHLGDIKAHVLDGHPVSLVYTSEEKHNILQSWARRHENTLVASDSTLQSVPEMTTKDLERFPSCAVENRNCPGSDQRETGGNGTELQL